jgi:hypothetical protein
MRTPIFVAIVDTGKPEPLRCPVPYAETCEDAQEWIDDQINYMNRTYAGCEWRVMRIDEVRKLK